MIFAHPYQPHPSIAHVWDAGCDELARDHRWIAVREIAPNKFGLIGFYDEVNKMLREARWFAERKETRVVSDQVTGDTHVFNAEVFRI